MFSCLKKRKMRKVIQVLLKFDVNLLTELLMEKWENYQKCSKESHNYSSSWQWSIFLYTNERSTQSKAVNWWKNFLLSGDVCLTILCNIESESIIDNFADLWHVKFTHYFIPTFVEINKNPYFKRQTFKIVNI